MRLVSSWRPSLWAIRLLGVCTLIPVEMSVSAHVAAIGVSARAHIQDVVLSQQDRLYLNISSLASDFTLLALNSLIFDINNSGWKKVRFTGFPAGTSMCASGEATKSGYQTATTQKILLLEILIEKSSSPVQSGVLVHRHWYRNRFGCIYIFCSFATTTDIQ